MAGAHSVITSIADNAKLYNTTLTYTDNQLSGTASAQTSYSVFQDGRISKIQGSSQLFDQWLFSGYFSNFDIYATQNSGDALSSSDLLNTWLNLSANRTFRIEAIQNTPGVITKTCNLTITLALAANHLVVLSTVTVNLTAVAEVSV